MKIAILDDYQDALRSLTSFSRLAGHEVVVWKDHCDDIDTLAARLNDVEALILIRERTQIGAPLLARLPKLRLISQHGPCPHIDLEACTGRGIVVCSYMGADQPSHATAELCWGLILCALRHIPYEVEALKAGRWQSTIGTGLHGRTLGILGYGRIGALVAGYGRVFGMRVLAWGREASLARARADGHATASSREQLFAESDVLSLHLRLNAATLHGVAAEDLARMKPTALLVNTSRADLVASGALEAALEAGRPGMAAVDVFETEPVRDGAHPLLSMKNALCTPHLGYVERDGYERRNAFVFDQVVAFANGRPINVLNPAGLAAAGTS